MKSLDKLRKAKQDFITVLDINADNINANLSMGQYWYNQTEYNRAINFFDKVIEVDGRISDAYLFKRKISSPKW